MYTNYSQVDSFFTKDSMQVKCSSAKLLQTKFKFPTPRPAELDLGYLYNQLKYQIWIKENDPILCELTISSYIP
jgi:hypothetical protein